MKSKSQDQFSFDKELIVTKLQSLQSTQKVIEDASDLFIDYGENGYAEELIIEWNNCLLKAIQIKDEKKILSLIYLANDILQKTKEKATQSFSQEFQTPIFQMVEKIVKTDLNNIKKELIKVFKIWQDKNVYSQQFLIDCTQRLQDIELSEINNLPENLPNLPSDLLKYLQNEQEFQKYRVKAEESKKKCSDIGNQNIPEYQKEFNEYQRCHSLSNTKYRLQILKSQKEILQNLDKAHMKAVVDLKLLLQKLDTLQAIKDKSDAQNFPTD